jgi:hypothetical protein
VGEEGRDAVAEASAIQGIGVEVSEVEHRPLRQRRGASGIVAERRAVEVLGPEPDLVVIAAPVEALLAVEERRRRVGGKEMQPAAVRQRTDSAFRRTGSLLPRAISCK